MLPRNHPDRMPFDVRRLVANAGLLLPATLAQHLGLPQMVQKHLDLGDGPVRANTGDKMMTLVVSALAGGDCLDAADVLRPDGTARALGCTVKAHRPWGPSCAASKSRPAPATAGRQHPLCVATAPYTLPYLLDQTLTVSFPCISSLV